MKATPCIHQPTLAYCTMLMPPFETILFEKNVDYIVNEEGEVVIVDEHTGRTMPGRRWSEGLHQAVEAKEGVNIQNENQTLASITFQNFFRLYEKLSGMTGTADTEAFEFQSIYGLETVVIPTNKPMIRNDMPDVVYRTEEEKFNAIIEDIKQRVEKGQPSLWYYIHRKIRVAIESTKNANIKHNVLNAKFHEREAEIVAEAGTLVLLPLQPTWLDEEQTSYWVVVGRLKSMHLKTLLMIKSKQSSLNGNGLR